MPLAAPSETNTPAFARGAPVAAFVICPEIPPTPDDSWMLMFGVSRLALTVTGVALAALVAFA